jgi:hypothetical protein
MGDAIAIGMKKTHHTPEKDGLEAIVCAKCGRYMSSTKVGQWQEGFEHYNEINWDKKGKFFYISNRTHSPRFCFINSRRTTRKVY